MSDDKKKMMAAADSPNIDSKKRARSRIFSDRETDVIREYMVSNYAAISAKHTSGGPTGFNSKRKQDSLWAELTTQVNAVGVAPRSVLQVKERWRNMVKKAKTEVTMHKVSARKTGGGPALPEMSTVSRDVAEIMNTNPSFHGIPDATDSETVVIDFTGDHMEESMQQLLGWIQDSSSGSITSNSGCGIKIDNEHLQQEPTTGVVFDDIEVADAGFGKSDINKKHTPGVRVVDSANGPPENGNKADSKGAYEMKGPKPVKQNRKPKSLKDLQIEYYEKGIQLQETQIRCFEKLTQAADVIMQKYSKT